MLYSKAIQVFQANFRIRTIKQNYIHMKELLKKGIAIFGTKANFLNWIETENEALGNITPDSLLDSTQGVSIVYDLLMKIEQNSIS